MSQTLTLKRAPTGVDSAKLFVDSTDTLATNGTATSVTPGTNNPTRYSIVWDTNVADGTYQLVLYDGGVAVAGADVLVSGSTITEVGIADSVLDGLDSIEITRISPFNPLTQSFILIQDDDYIYENGTHVDIDLVETSITLSTATATVTAKAKLASSCAGFSGEASIVIGSPNKLRVEWPSAGSGQPVGEYIWQAKVIDSATNKKTEFEGPLTLKRSTDG